MRRSRLAIRGTVQGVGFRPFLLRVADELGVTGYVVNDRGGVRCEVQGADDAVERFITRVRSDAPPLARLDHVEVESLEPVDGDTGFVIAPSPAAIDGRAAGAPLSVPADVASCPACRDELDDPTDRRFGYPFICCVDCGPRYTVVDSLPYDRERTSMAPFPLCDRCAREYGDPTARRFHAQATCCPDCGPTLILRSVSNVARPTVTGNEALERAVAALVNGRIVAVKGLGGFQLMCRADTAEVVKRLRARKVRIDKPFALLAPDLGVAAALVELDDAARAALTDSAAPIVLAARRADAKVAPDVAPHHDTLGVMLPSTPLHHLVARRLYAATGSVAVCTSGNRSDEPMVLDDAEAVITLGGIADDLLGHDRRIERRADDSIGHVIDGRFQVLRRARGFAPRPIRLPNRGPTVLAVGAELKNTVGVAVGSEAVLSVHLGDLEHPAALRAFEMAVADLLDLVGGSLDLVAHDLHPEYLSTKFAMAAELAPSVGVQHHHAHLASCLVDNEHRGPVIGVTFDGLGWGSDDTLWGGEFLVGSAAGFERVAHLAPVPMPNGAAAIREPWRMALHHLRAAGIEPPAVGWLADREPARLFEGEAGVVKSSPTTTSMGRLFDAVGALCGVVGGDRARHEGQAAIQLEQLAASVDPGGGAGGDAEDSSPYGGQRFDRSVGSPIGDRPAIIAVDRMLAAVVEDLRSAVEPSVVAARFHRWVAAVVVDTCELVRPEGVDTVALTGGVFQNRLLTGLVQARLRGAGFEVLIHHRVPANDGGIALGQLAVARALVVEPPASTLEP